MKSLFQIEDYQILAANQQETANQEEIVIQLFVFFFCFRLSTSILVVGEYLPHIMFLPLRNNIYTLRI